MNFFKKREELFTTLFEQEWDSTIFLCAKICKTILLL